ncbi:hypothetical protein NNC51_05405, partial [Prevotella copri]
CRVSDFICIFAILKEVFCKDTNLLRKGKARACESLGFVVNKNNFFSSVSGKRRKTKRVRHRLMTHPLPVFCR